MLFDMDGVLVRSEEVWFRLVEESGRRFRGRAVTREEFLPTFGQGTSADVAAFGLTCMPAELDAFYVEHFFRYLDELWVDPDAARVLQALAEQGRKRAVVTNTVTPLARRILDAAGLRPHLNAVLGADLVPHAKPAPDLVHAALRAVDVPAARACLVGDSRFDAAAAKGAGVPFVGFRLDAAVRVESLGELPGLWG